jgi:pimeloyl-ACP methyl ester carboxylesterase
MKHILHLHGAIGSKDHFDLLTKSLSDYYMVHQFNFSGHGGKEMKDKFSIELFADELMQWINEKQLDGLSVFGYSMGG